MRSPKRNRAKTPFRRKEQRLKDAQALGKIGDWEFDVQTGLINWSDEVYRLFEREAATGPPTFSEMLASFFPEDALRLEECARLAIETGESYQLDLHARLPSGRDAYQFAIGRASKDSGGKVIKLYGIVQDITERRRAQDALAESEREQRRIALELESERSRLVEAQKVAGVGSWENDLATSKLTWSEQTYSIFEIDPSDVCITRPKFVEFIHPEDTAKVNAAFDASLYEGAPSMVGYRIVMPDGRVKFIDERWEVLRDEQGKPVRVAGTCLDTTDRMRAEQEARTTHQRLTYLIENSPLAVVEWDSSLRVQRWSRRAEELFGWRAEEVKGLSPGDWLFVHPDDQPAASKIVAGLLQHGERRNLSIARNYTRDGRTIYCEWYNSALLGPDGNLLSILSLGNDITERRQAEESLLQSQRQLRALSAHLETLREQERSQISREIHDELGQMLTAVKMDLRWMEHCLDEFGEDRRLNPILDKLVAASELVDATVNTVQRIATELRSNILDKLGLSAAIEREAAQFEERTGISCTVVVPCNPPPLQPEISTAFYRIFRECLTNIIRHANASAVQVEFQAADVFRLDVRDNGRGISADERNLNSPGLLGMQERARLLGGEFSISRQSGGGTVVTVLIPGKSGGEGSV